MSLPLPFTEDQRDCLQEIINVAMGAAGESLAAFAGVFVKLSIPVIRFIKPEDLPAALSAVDDGEKISVVAQRFTTATTEGYALVAVTESSFKDLSTFTGRTIDGDDVATELLMDLCHTICSTCLNRLAEMREEPISLQDPTELLALRVPPSQLRCDDLGVWDALVSAEINYHLEDHPFNCDLLLLFPDTSLDELKAQLDALLA